MDLHDRLRQDLASALASRDMATARVLRTLVAAIENAAAVAPGPALGTTGSADVPRRHVGEAEQLGIIGREAEELRSAVAEYEAHGRDDVAGALRDRLAVIEHYLPPR